MTLADTLTAAGFGIATAGLLLGAAALTLALTVMRQSGRALATARRAARRTNDLTNDVDALLDRADQTTEWITAADTQIVNLTQAINGGDTPPPDGPPPTTQLERHPPTTAMPATDRPTPGPRP